jgi:AraC-like DNA-binding protein
MDYSPKKSGPPLLRLGHLMAFTAFLGNAGAPADRYLRDQKLPVLCDDPDMFVPLTRAWAFFDSTARSEDPALGWLVGAHVGDHKLNAGLLRKLETAPSLLLALQGLVRLARSEASHIQLGIQERRDDVLLYTHYSGMRDVPGYANSQSYQLGVILDLIRHFLGRNWVPEEMGIEHAIAPAVAQKLFPGSRILTQQPMGYIAVPRTCLHIGVPHSAPDSGLGKDPVPSENFDYLDTLRALLKAYLPDGYPSAQFAAALMGTSERTLARRLSARGLTYGNLIDEVRFSEAKKLLRTADVRIGDIAISVGFHDQSHFTRMFRRLGGLSPKEFRKAVRP